MSLNGVRRAAEREFEVIGPARRPRPGLPVLSIVRNEMGLLPVFLEHNRALGAGRFYILDDGSSDGTREYLLTQDDVTVLTAVHRFGDAVGVGDWPYAAPTPRDLRYGNFWRSLLMERFAKDGWAMQSDVDEHLVLPEGMGLDDVVGRLEADGAETAWAAMIDLYPERASDVLGGAPETPLWFDGVRQISLDGARAPRHRHIGTRRRLEADADVTPRPSLAVRLKLKLRGARRSPSGTLVKQPICRWREGAHYRTAHVTTLERASRTVLLALAHHYYHPGLGARLDGILASGGYTKSNAAYHRLKAVLERLAAEDRALTYARSRRYRGYADFAATGNVRGL